MFTQSFNNVPLDVNNYDILLRRHVNNHVEIMSFADHVGNRRFQILIELHRKAYNTATQKNDTIECERILEAVAHTIYDKCVPKGRFLEQDMSSPSMYNEGKWYYLDNGPLVRERIRRGFLGLLFTLPVERKAILPDINVAPEKKRARINLSDERFVVQGFAPRKAKRIRRKKSNIDPSPQVSSIRVPASEILNDDILFCGKNGDEVLLLDHIGNERLQHILHWKSRSLSNSNSSDVELMDIARDTIHKISSSYPGTRFLRKLDSTTWVQMDVNTVMSKLTIAICNASKFFVGNKFSKSDDVSIPLYSISSDSSEEMVPNMGSSRAA